MKNFTKLIISCLIVLTGFMPLHAQGQEFNHEK